MDQLITKLNQIPNAYYEFIDSTVEYASAKTEHLSILLNFLDEKNDASVTDVLRFISHQPDFFDDVVKKESIAV